MKKLFVVSFLMMSLFCYSQNKQSNSTIERKVDSLLSIVRVLQNQKNDSTLIKIDKLDEVFKKSESKWTDKLLPALIALITVLISSGVAYKVGVRNAKTQVTNAETQARTQIAIAADQLDISRKQIEQNTKNTLAQIRSNNISKARIEWIEALRPILSELFVNIFEAWHSLKLLKNTQADNNKEETIKIFKVYEGLSFKIQSQKNQVELFLNPANISHLELLTSIDNFINQFLNMNSKLSDEELYDLSGLVIEKSRVVLKEAWEKAKSETTI